MSGILYYIDGRKMVKVLLALLMPLCSLLTTQAQEDPEYRMEAGAGAGVAIYYGDFNGKLFRSMQPMGALHAKYKMNPRMAWAANLGVGKLKGSSKNVTSWYPDLAENPIEFSSTLVYLDLRYEYNFWAFGTGREYHGARPLSPFITLGAGLAYAKPGKSVVALQMPIGLGFKYKLQDRLNLSLEWLIHFSGSDKLDGTVDPYGIKSSGLFKNTDGYGTLQVTLTYDFWEKCKTCNNDRD